MQLVLRWQYHHSMKNERSRVSLQHVRYRPRVEHSAAKNPMLNTSPQAAEAGKQMYVHVFVAAESTNLLRTVTYFRWLSSAQLAEPCSVAAMMLSRAWCERRKLVGTIAHRATVKLNVIDGTVLQCCVSNEPITSTCAPAGSFPIYGTACSPMRCHVLCNFAQRHNKLSHLCKTNSLFVPPDSRPAPRPTLKQTASLFFLLAGICSMYFFSSRPGNLWLLSSPLLAFPLLSELREPRSRW